MNNSDDDYHVSLFKPKTPHAKANRDMVILFFCIWAIAIFGFQILLKVLEKPVPESTYTDFESVWSNVEDADATGEQLKVLAGSTLSVLGKVAIEPSDRQVLQRALSYAVFQLADSDRQIRIQKMVGDFEKKKSDITSISDQDYVSMKDEISTEVSPLIGLSSQDVRIKILPLELTSDGLVSESGQWMKQLPQVMSRYLIHNQSILTDTRFLGFPFHYFYTAIFLLILFVGLCWLYCYRTDIINVKFGISD